MRVLLSCLQSRKQHPLPAYAFWEEYFRRGLAEAGADCVDDGETDWAEGLVYPGGEKLRAWRSATWERVLAFARREQRRHPIQMFLSYLYPAQIEPAAIHELQRMGIPTVNFFCDNVREYVQLPTEFRPFTLHWVPEYEALPMYRRAGLSHIHAPMPCWITPELRNVPDQEREPPTFIGSGDVLRRNLLGCASEAGAEFAVYGDGWGEVPGNGSAPLATRSIGRIVGNQVALIREKGVGSLVHKVANRIYPLRPATVPASRIRRAVTKAEYLRITREAVVTIGINRVPSAHASNRRPLRYSRLRDVEAPMLGACYLTEWTRGLSELYEIGTEIEVYRTAEELSAKLTELKGNPTRRRLMRERAQKRALADHSVPRTLRRISVELGLK